MQRPAARKKLRGKAWHWRPESGGKQLHRSRENAVEKKTILQQSKEMSAILKG
jgi:hypothetical protein